MPDNTTILTITIVVLTYLIGSIPWAYIIVKIFYSEDLRKKGTGNIGAMNSFEITGKKWIGIAVFILDCVKGIVAILITRMISIDNVIIIALSGFFVVLGHNFSVFMRFSGGRGLSTSVGIGLMINPWLVIVWAFVWAVIYLLIKKNVHIANSVASVMLPAVLIILPQNLLMTLEIIPGFDKEKIIFLSLAISILILIRHLKPIYELIKK